MARNSMKNVCRLIKQAEKPIPAEAGFLGDLKRSIEIDAEKDSRKPSPTYKPSGMKCIRQSYYQITEAEPDEPRASYIGVGICNSGTDIHERIQKAVAGMKENGFDCEYIDVAEFVKQRDLGDIEVKSQQGMETKLYHKLWNISFMCDGIIKYKNHYYILELKTETSNKWFSRGGVDPYHYNQAIAYSLALRLNEVVFVYISRDTLDMKAYMLNVTDDMRKSLCDYMSECNRFILEEKCPPKPKDVERKVCEYCGYRTQCMKDGD